MPHDLRDEIVDFLHHYRTLTGIAIVWFLALIQLSPRKFQHWKGRYGKVNEHNAMIPRDHWIEQEERSAIVRTQVQLGRLSVTNAEVLGGLVEGDEVVLGDMQAWSERPRLRLR